MRGGMVMGMVVRGGRIVRCFVGEVVGKGFLYVLR